MNRLHLFITGLWLLGTLCIQSAQAGTYIDNINTDKAMYSPGSSVTIYVDLKNTTGSIFSGTVEVTIFHLGAVVANLPEQGLTLGAGGTAAKVFSWLPPVDDFKGYLVAVSLKNGSGAVVESGSSAIDVSSDWKRFPRYGYVSYFDGGVDAWNTVWQLKNYHINGLEFYDWQWKHHIPYKPEPDAVWPDIAQRSTSRATVSNLISAAHSYGMMAMNYNLYGGAYEDYQTDGSGVTLSMGIFGEPKPAGGYTLDEQMGHNLGSWAATDKICTMNNRDIGWQNYIYGREQDVFDHFAFDGWHIDSLGSGTVWDYAGNTFNLLDYYPAFINHAKAALNKRMVYNSVDAGGEGLIAQNADVDFIYSELWGGNARYIDLKERVDSVRSYGSKAVVFPAYINYEKTSGYFNEASVRLADASIFACGAAHLELGDGSEMLRTEYFPENTVKMSAALKNTLRTYYDFLVGYENLLRGDAVSADHTVTVASTATSTNGSAGAVWLISKKAMGCSMVHLVNLLNNTGTEWRDAYGTYAAPPVKTNLAMKMYYSGTVADGKLWWASPDINDGVASSLSFTTGSDGGGNYVNFTLPYLHYWDMIWLEIKGTKDAAMKIEAEKYDSMAGIGTEATSDAGGGRNVGFVSNTQGDSYLAFNDVDFGTGMSSVSMRVASALPNGLLELHLDRPDGPLIGTVEVGHTGGWQSWQTETADLSGATGIRDLYIVFRNAASNLNWFQFQISGNVAADRADHAAYNDGWQDGDNGGYGFSVWDFGENSTGSRAGIRSSTDNGGGSSIDAAGASFYLSNEDGSGLYLDVLRYLNADLLVGQTLSMDMDINWRNGHKGIDIRGEDDMASIFKFEIGNQGSGDDHVVMNAATGNGSIGNAWSDNTQFHVALEQSGIAGGIWKITRSGGINDYDEGTYSGTVSSIQFYFNGDGNSANSADATYYNNLSVAWIPAFDFYGAWTNQYELNGSDADMGADPDYDSMDNLFEFALGGNPTTNDATLVKPGFYHVGVSDTNLLSYVYNRYTDAAVHQLIYRLETTWNMMSSAWSTNGYVELPPTDVGKGFETVTNLVVATNSTMFLRLRVEAR